MMNRVNWGLSSMALWTVLSACTVDRVDFGPLSATNGVEGVGETSSVAPATSSSTVGTSVTCVAFNEAGDVRDISCDDLDLVIGAGFCVQYYLDGAAGSTVCPPGATEAPEPGTCSALGKDGRVYTTDCGETTAPATSSSAAICTGTDEHGNLTGVPCTDATVPAPTVTSESPSPTAAPTTHESTTVEVTTSDSRQGSTTAEAGATSGVVTGTTTVEPCEPTNARGPRSPGCPETDELVTEPADGGSDVSADAGVEGR